MIKTEFDNKFMKAAEDAKKILSKEILACKDCAYAYNTIMQPYAKDNSYAIISWDLNKLKGNDANYFPKCRDAVFSYSRKIFNDTHPGYSLNKDDDCFFVSVL